MRLIFAGLSNHGHIYPLLPLAVACRAAGHEVIFAVGAEFVAPLRRLGFAVEQIGASIGWGFSEAVRQNPGLRPDDEQRVAPLATEILAEKVLRELLPLLERTNPDLVVHEPYCLGAPLAADLAGVPAVSYLQGRSLPKAMHEAVTPGLTRLWQRYGNGTELPDWLGGHFLDSWPSSLQPDPPVLELTNRSPIRPVAWHDPAAHVPAWVTDQRSRPLIYLALSTVFDLPLDVLRSTVQGLLDLDVDVLAVIGPQNDHGVLGQLPERVRVERFVAQAAVLPHADVVVSHAGSGTMLGALGAGVPQLAIPYGADQFSNAMDIARTRTGRHLPHELVTAETIRDEVGTLLREPVYRETARRVSREITGMPSPESVVPVLQGLADNRRPSRRPPAPNGAGAPAGGPLGPNGVGVPAGGPGESAGAVDTVNAR